MKFHINILVTILVFLIVFLGGMFFFHRVEGWKFINSAYFVAMTVTTIGYGDFVPKSDVGKIFTIFYSFFGVGVALYLLTTMSSNLFKKHLSNKVGQIKRGIRMAEELKGKKKR